MVQSKSSKEIKEYILQLEEKYPVNQWKIYGVDIWPFIRIKLYIFLLNLGSKESKINKSNNPVRINSTLKKSIDAPRALFKAVATLIEFFLKLKSKKIVFFGSHFHRTKHNEVYFNRFFDPMVDEHHLQDEVYMIEFEKVYKVNYNQKAILALHNYLDQYKYIKKIKGIFRSSNEGEINLDGYRAFFDEVTRKFPETEKLNISVERLKKWAQKIIRSKGFFINLYKRTKPEKIIFLSYYGYDDMAAAILAAHELKIKTIDFQHGPQTNVHMAYSAWTKHPDKPYNTMPIEYWTWDLRSKENIEKWAQNTEFIKAINFGHPYLAFFKKKILSKNMSDKIVFSLQTLSLEEMFPTGLLDLIKESEIKWILRMHPRSNFTKNDLESFLKKNKIHKNIYEIEDALEIPLPESLAGANLHITNFSGCVIEAGMLNIPSLLMHESGREIFSAYIDGKSVFYLNPDKPGFKEGFNDILKNLPEGNRGKESWLISNPLLVEGDIVKNA